MLKRWLFVLATGYCLVFFSELLFWGTSSLPALLETWLFYSLAAYLFLVVVARYRVNSLPSLFLAGAFYGWLVEGVLVQTTYEELPVSISNTGLSWHALLSVCVGWFLMRRALLQPRPSASIALGAGIGALWGFWMPFWGYQSAPGVLPPTMASMLVLAGLSTPALIASYRLQSRLSATPFTPPRAETLTVAGLFLLQFLFIAVPAYPIALAVLPALLLTLWFALRRHARATPIPESYLELLSGRIPVRNLLGVALIGPVAALAFAFGRALDLTPLPQYALYALTVPAGFVLLLLSLVEIARVKEPPATAL